MFLYAVSIILALVFLILLYFLIFNLKIKSLSNYIWLIVIAGTYTYFTLELKDVPEETVHFLEYGLLGYLLYKALSHSVKDKSIYLTAAFFALLVGTFDEILQWIIPNRHWEFRDVGLNGISGGLFQLALWAVVKPKKISEKINSHSLRILTSVFAVCLILLGLCTLNTPKRVALYTRKIPFLHFLQQEEPMSEYGNKHMDPEIGIFYSRLSLENLNRLDKEMGKNYSSILNNSADMKYNQFLREYNPASNPFLYELRIHVFRRNKYYKEGIKKSNLDKKKEFLFIAYKENLILEKYFTESIKNTIYSFDRRIISKIEPFIDKEKSYRSPISSNLFTTLSEKEIWTSILAIILLLLILNLFFPYIKNKKNATRQLE